MQLVRIHPFENSTDDTTIVESIVRSARQTITFTHAGLDAFEFKVPENGTHYVVNRATAMRCMQFDQLVCYTSPRMVAALNRRWSEPGRC